MKLHIIVKYGEVMEVNPLTITIENQDKPEDKYYIHKDKKWKDFCKKHHFNPRTDVNGKIYRLYLDLCAEGIIK